MVAAAGLGLISDIWTVPYDVTARLVRDTDTDDAQAVFISCTNLPTYDVIATLEAELGKPVLTANQVTIWSALTRHRPQGRRPRSAVAGVVTMADRAVTTRSTPSRLRRVREAMAQRAFGALVVCDPANLFYLTGYDAWSFYTPQCLLVGAEGAAAPVRAGAGRRGRGATPATCPTTRSTATRRTLCTGPDVHPFDWIACRDPHARARR